MLYDTNFAVIDKGAQFISGPSFAEAEIGLLITIGWDIYYITRSEEEAVQFRYSRSVRER